MPADAISGLIEAVVALVEGIVQLISAAVEGTFTLFELVLEAACLLIELLLFIIGKGRRIGRPAWVVRRRQSPAGRIKSLVIAVLFFSAIAYGTFQYFGYTRLSFSHGGIARPDSVDVMLIRGEASQVAVIEDGKLKILRGRWDRLVVHDPRYQPSDFAITGCRMDLHLDKIQTTREAATEAVIDKAAELLRKKFGSGEESNEE